MLMKDDTKQRDKESPPYKTKKDLLTNFYQQAQCINQVGYSKRTFCLRAHPIELVDRL